MAALALIQHNNITNYYLCYLVTYTKNKSHESEQRVNTSCLTYVEERLWPVYWSFDEVPLYLNMMSVELPGLGEVTAISIHQSISINQSKMLFHIASFLHKLLTGACIW